MCIYCDTNNYRKIYQNHYGPIPKEPNGRSYEIHHIDGNHDNNDPSNLIAITIQEHYNWHYAQGDYGACFLIMTERMIYTPEEISNIASLSNKKRVIEGTHHLLGGAVTRKQIADGKHYFSGPINNQKRIQDGTHHLLSRLDGSSLSSDRVKNGTHNLLGSSNNLTRLEAGNHPSQIKISCIKCKQVTSAPMFARWHGEKCQ